MNALTVLLLGGACFGLVGLVLYVPMRLAGLFDHHPKS